MVKSAWKRSVVGGLIFALALAGCTAQDQLEPEIDEAEPTVEVPQEIVPDVPRHPLTGFEVAEGSVTGPAIMAKIDHENRPYVNLHRADIVWQQLIPQNGTRFIAVWHSDVPDSVSYVRSFRPHDYTMASPFGGVLASTGLFSGIRDYLDALDRAGVKNVVWDFGVADEKPLWRNTGKPYSAASSIEFAAAAAQEQFSSFAPPQQYFDYVATPDETTAVRKGEPQSNVTVYYSRSESNNYLTSKWQWDAAEGLYKKVFINGEPVLSDAANWTSGSSCGECVQISATNLVVMSVEHDDIVGQPTARFTDGAEGPAWIATGGKVLKVNWRSGAIGVPFEFTDRDGEPVTLAPGQTWIMVFPGEASGPIITRPGGPGAGSISFD